MKLKNSRPNIQKNSFLKTAVSRIVREFKPVKIILFGSHAHGKPTPDSDMDLLIVKNTRLPCAQRFRQVSSLIGQHIYPLDLIVLTPGEIRRRLRGFDPFLDEALTHGRVLYDKNG